MGDVIQLRGKLHFLAREAAGEAPGEPGAVLLCAQPGFRFRAIDGTHVLLYPAPESGRNGPAAWWKAIGKRILGGGRG